MELIDRIKKRLSEEYGINSAEELMEAIENQKAVDVGIFTKEVGEIEKAG